MTKIVAKSLPNAVSPADVTDAAVRQKIMLLNGNIRSLASQLAEAQKALVELQGGASKDSAEQSVSWSTSISFLYQAFTRGRTVLMEGIVPDTTKTYSVKFLFRNTTEMSRQCKVNDYDGDDLKLQATIGATVSKTLNGVSGSGSFTFANASNTVDVFIFITKEL